MIAIAPHFSENFGHEFPQACIEVEEVSARRNANFFTAEGNRNAMVRIRVWASENARTQGRQPIEVVERFIDIDPEITSEIHATALNELFPQAETKQP